MILAVTGGRDFACTANDYERISKAIASLGVTELRHGGCRGADKAVATFVLHNFPHVRVNEYHADWKALGRAAGPIRNEAMMVGAGGLLALPGGRGTEDATRRAMARGLRVYTLDDWDAAQGEKGGA